MRGEENEKCKEEKREQARTIQDQVKELQGEAEQMRNANLYLRKRMAHLQDLHRTLDQTRNKVTHLKGENNSIKMQLIDSTRRRELS